MELPHTLARFNKLVTNRIQGRWAWILPPWAVVAHTGRKSGRAFRTPVMAWRTRDGIAIGLPYGEGSQWVRNLIAAGGGHLVRRRRVFVLSNPRVTDVGDVTGLRTAGRLTGGISGRVLIANLKPAGLGAPAARPSNWRNA